MTSFIVFFYGVIEDIIEMIVDKTTINIFGLNVSVIEVALAMSLSVGVVCILFKKTNNYVGGISSSTKTITNNIKSKFKKG